MRVESERQERNRTVIELLTATSEDVIGQNGAGSSSEFTDSDFDAFDQNRFGEHEVFSPEADPVRIKSTP